MKIELDPMPPATNPEPAVATAVLSPEADALRRALAVQTELHLRLAADFENYKRRSRQEIDSRVLAQTDAMLVALLPVVDNLERALAAGGARDPAPISEGVAMTLSLLQRLLRGYGLVSDEIIGTPFDPHRQEALAQGYDPNQPDQTVLSVFQRGYRRGETVVRPASVTVNDRTVVS